MINNSNQYYVEKKNNIDTIGYTELESDMDIKAVTENSIILSTSLMKVIPEDEILIYSCQRFWEEDCIGIKCSSGSFKVCPIASLTYINIGNYCPPEARIARERNSTYFQAALGACLAETKTTPESLLIYPFIPLIYLFRKHLLDSDVYTSLVSKVCTFKRLFKLSLLAEDELIDLRELILLTGQLVEAVAQEHYLVNDAIALIKLIDKAYLEE